MILTLHWPAAALSAAFRAALRRGLLPSLMLLALPAAGADYLWYGADELLGGNNTWDATNPYWLTGGARTLWPNAAATTARAVFGGTVAAPFTVTIPGGASINANALWFQNTYTLAAGNPASTLNFVGSTPTLRVDPGLTVTTNVQMTGAAVTLTGGGTWLLGASDRLGDSLGVLVDGGSTFSLGPIDDIAGKITLIAGTLAGTGTLTTTDSFDLLSGSVDVALDGTGRALYKRGSGTVTLNGANTYTGATNVSEGTLQLGANDRIDNGSALNVSGGNFSLGRFSETVGAVMLASGSISGTTGVLTGSSYTVQSGSVSAVLGGKGALTKTTTGTVVLSGANTYTGATAIDAGTLQLNGSVGNTTVSVNGGGTLAGIGAVTGGRVNVRGTLSPGIAGPGTLTTMRQTWYGGGDYIWQIANATGTAGLDWDRLVLNGRLTIDATSTAPFTLRVVGLDAAGSGGVVKNFSNTQSYSWSLLQATSIRDFSGSKFIIDSTAFAAFNPLGGGSFSVTASGSSLDLVFSPVPEPRTYALLLGAGVLGFSALRRWRRGRALV